MSFVFSASTIIVVVAGSCTIWTDDVFCSSLHHGGEGGRVVAKRTSACWVVLGGRRSNVEDLGIFPRLPVVPLEDDKEDIRCRHIAAESNESRDVSYARSMSTSAGNAKQEVSPGRLVVRRLSRPKHLCSLAASGIISQTPHFSSNNLSDHVDDSDNWHDCSPSTNCRSNSEFYEHRSPPRSTKTIPINLGGIGS